MIVLYSAVPIVPWATRWAPRCVLFGGLEARKDANVVFLARRCPARGNIWVADERHFSSLPRQGQFVIHLARSRQPGKPSPHSAQCALHISVPIGTDDYRAPQKALSFILATMPRYLPKKQ